MVHNLESILKNAPANARVYAVDHSGVATEIKNAELVFRSKVPMVFLYMDPLGPTLKAEWVERKR